MSVKCEMDCGHVSVKCEMDCGHVSSVRWTVVMCQV